MVSILWVFRFGGLPGGMHFGEADDVGQSLVVVVVAGLVLAREKEGDSRDTQHTHARTLRWIVALQRLAQGHALDTNK